MRPVAAIGILVVVGVVFWALTSGPETTGPDTSSPLDVAGKTGDESRSQSMAGDRVPVPTSAVDSEPASGGEDDEKPADPKAAEAPEDPAMTHISKTIEHLHTPEGRGTFIADTNLDELLDETGVTLTPEERDEVQSELGRLDEQIEEAWFAETIEQHRAIQDAILRGDVQQHAKGAVPYMEFLNQGAAVSFVPGAEKGKQRIVVLTAANSPEWARAREAHGAVRQKREQFIKFRLTGR